MFGMYVTSNQSRKKFGDAQRTCILQQSQLDEIKMMYEIGDISCLEYFGLLALLFFSD